VTVRLTPARVRRKLLLVVGRQRFSTMTLGGPPIAGWCAVYRATGNIVWLKCHGRPGLRYTEPRAYRHAVNTLSPAESKDLWDDFFHRNV